MQSEAESVDESADSDLADLENMPLSPAEAVLRLAVVPREMWTRGLDTVEIRNIALSVMPWLDDRLGDPNYSGGNEDLRHFAIGALKALLEEMQAWDESMKRDPLLDVKRLLDAWVEGVVVGDRELFKVPAVAALVRARIKAITAKRRIARWV